MASYMVPAIFLLCCLMLCLLCGMMHEFCVMFCQLVMQPSTHAFFCLNTYTCIFTLYLSLGLYKVTFSLFVNLFVFAFDSISVSKKCKYSLIIWKATEVCRHTYMYIVRTYLYRCVA